MNSAPLWTVIGGITMLAMFAVAVSRNAQTPQVIQSAGGFVTGIIGAAVSPVTGSSSSSFGSAINALGAINGMSGYGPLLNY